MNSEMPLTLWGAPVVLASTRWMMLSLRSCSPAEMKILVPVILCVPSSCGSARVRIRPRSVPHWGSVRFIVPVQRPCTMFGRYICFCASDPTAVIAACAPSFKPGYIENAMLALDRNSATAVPTTWGSPCPPYSGDAVKVPQPPSTNWS